MKSIVLTYPDFHSLPKGLKMLLVESECFFYREENSPSGRAAANTAACRAKNTRPQESRFILPMILPPHAAGRNPDGLPPHGQRAFPE
ncbi:MAG TPA: hypothetical protein VFW05_04075 [Verrucomicrobiae bacterium]|nr:hypothetical protein [Verrucomicrobiae bacterium]